MFACNSQFNTLNRTEVKPSHLPVIKGVNKVAQGKNQPNQNKITS